MPSGQVFGFNEVFHAEVGAINARRERQGRGTIALREDAADSCGDPILGPNEDANVVGLALSGGRRALGGVLPGLTAGLE